MLLPILIRILQNQTDLKCQSEDNTCDQEFQVTTRACYIKKASAGNRDCVKFIKYETRVNANERNINRKLNEI